MPSPTRSFVLISFLILSPVRCARAEDAPPPSQALRTDVLTRAPRFALGLVARAPFQRTYAVGLQYAVLGALALEARLGLDESLRAQLGGGVLLRPLGRRFEGPYLRLEGGLLLPGDSQSGEARQGTLQALVGASTVLSGLYTDLGLGVLRAYANGTPGMRARFVIEARVGFVF